MGFYDEEVGSVVVGLECVDYFRSNIDRNIVYPNIIYLVADSEENDVRGVGDLGCVVVDA